ncbi:MAG TPA: erythromycin esterase family protein [Ktedonobacteraceae bacterium]|nr:erythromycin esterase family protein [Ktedonobacteraceae bacterium]
MHQANDVVISWIKENTIPLTTLDPQAPLDDLAPISQIVGNASLVALGEASHGGHEFFVMKHRLLRFLVEKMGFTLFAMEMSWMQAEAINDYVLTGTGDARSLLRKNTYRVWNTQEVLDLIEWLRAYNADAHHTQKVHFAGFDSVSPTAAGLDRIVEYVQKVDPQFSAQVATLYHGMDEISLLELPEPPVRQRFVEAAEQVYERLKEHEHEYIARSSPSAYTYILQEARVVKQVTLLIRHADARLHSDELRTKAQQRDHFMAENIHWLHEHAIGGEKMVLWAHNWHIGTWGEWRGERSGKIFPFTWMGIDLRQRYHDDYLTIGFSFFEGAHNAVLMDQEGNVIGPRQAYTLVPASQESYEHTLTRAGKLYLLDLRSVPVGEVSAWLDGPHPFRDFGAIHIEEGRYRNLSLTRWFDVLVHIGKISPTQLLPKA